MPHEHCLAIRMCNIQVLGRPDQGPSIARCEPNCIILFLELSLAAVFSMWVLKESVRSNVMPWYLGWKLWFWASPLKVMFSWARASLLSRWKQDASVLLVLIISIGLLFLYIYFVFRPYPYNGLFKRWRFR